MSRISGLLPFLHQPAIRYFVWISTHAAAGAILMADGWLGGLFEAFSLYAFIVLAPAGFILGPMAYGGLLGALLGLLTWPLALWRGLTFRDWVVRSVACWGLAGALGYVTISVSNRLGVLITARAWWADATELVYLGLVFSALFLLTWPLALRWRLTFRARVCWSVVAWVLGLPLAYEIFLVSGGPQMLTPAKADLAFHSGLVFSGLVFILAWPLALSRNLTFRGWVRWSISCLATGLLLGCGALAAPGSVGWLIAERARSAFAFGCAGLLTGLPLFRRPNPRKDGYAGEDEHALTGA